MLQNTPHQPKKQTQVQSHRGDLVAFCQARCGLEGARVSRVLTTARLAGGNEKSN